jgi:hypothetical protein
MKTILLLLISLLSVGCASDGVFGEPSPMPFGGDAPILVSLVGVDSGTAPLDRGYTRQYDITLEVSNMADYPVTIERLTLARPQTGGGAFVLDPLTMRVNQLLSSGEDAEFKLKGMGRQFRPFAPSERRVVQFTIQAWLTNGESYRFDFEAPVKELPYGAQ